MKHPHRFALIASLLAVLVSPTAPTWAATPGDMQIEIIRQNCVAAQASMQRLEQNEAVTRRNRGVSYESTLKLMAALNSRIAYNKLSVPALASTTAEVAKKRTEFNDNYIAYNNSFNVTMKLPNCRQQPIAFYDYLSQTRELRTKLSASVDEIDRLLDSYQAALNDLKKGDASPTETETAQ